MSANPSRPDPSPRADASSIPAVIVTLTPNQELTRMKQFPIRLKAGVRWMKHFLHGDK